MLWIIIGIVALGLVCSLPDIRSFIGLVRQAIQESRDKKPPLAGA